MFGLMLDDYDLFCNKHDEERPCRQCQIERDRRIKDDRLHREHAMLPIRRPKKLEQK
jgi:hypothetical protein